MLYAYTGLLAGPALGQTQGHGHDRAMAMAMVHGNGHSRVFPSLTPLEPVSIRDPTRYISCWCSGQAYTVREASS